MAKQPEFTFEISLSVLDHLGRHLYRSFATVLGEAISNAWDADAKNVWIYLDENKTGFCIKDDGIGMDEEDFQNKFLKIGYSKRKERKTSPENRRPFIGRKGIGKLALLSCANRVSIISKKKSGDYVGGTIENRKLDKAITDDLTPDKYILASFDLRNFAKYTKSHVRGTIIRFDGTKGGVKRSFEFLSKIIALYFRFSLIDPKFKIYLDDELITHKHLADLAERTQFLWKIGKFDDPYIKDLETRFSKNKGSHEKKKVTLTQTKGFIASVERPRNLKIMTTEERVGVDLFVNGRLRVRNILAQIPTARIVENYLYGQIHYNSLDDDKDRFTSSREGVVADDPKYQDFLKRLRRELLTIVADWDEWRIKHRDEGDSENKRYTKKQRASRTLYNQVVAQYKPAKKSMRADIVDGWVDDLTDDAAFNFESYAECFVSENLIRRYIEDKPIPPSPESMEAAKGYRTREKNNKNKGNISIKIRRDDGDLSYLAMDELANLVDRSTDNKQASLSWDARQFKPIRDAMAHTALLTVQAKNKLKTVRENIKSRINTLLSGGK